MNTTKKRSAPKLLFQNLQFRLKLRREALRNLNLQREIRARCARDIVFFCDTFCWVFEPRGKGVKVVPFITWECQEEALAILVESLGVDDIGIEKSRDMGASWLVLIAFLWLWLFQPHIALLVVSRNAKYVDNPGDLKSLFGKIDFLIKYLPKWLLPRGFDPQKHRLKMQIVNPVNDSVIVGESTTENIARGDRRYAVFIDELGAFKTLAGRQAVASCVGSTDSRVFVSTYKGASGAFYEEMENLKRTQGRLISLHWSMRPDYARGMYAATGGKLILIDVDYWLRTLGHLPAGTPVTFTDRRWGSFRGLLLEKAPEGYAFRCDGKLRSPYYDRQCKRLRENPKAIAEELDMNPQMAGGRFFVNEIVDRAFLVTTPQVSRGQLLVKDEKGKQIEYQKNSVRHPLRLWVPLDSTGSPPWSAYSIGADISTGSGASNTCFMVLDKRTGALAAEWTDPFTSTHDAALIYVAMARWFHDARACWEHNGCGIEFGNRVMKLYENYCLQRTKTIDNNTTRAPGWHPNQGKASMLRELEGALDDGKLTCYSSEAIRELEDFFYGEDGEPIHRADVDADDPSGAKKNHGDRVVALGLAWRALQETAIPVARQRAEQQLQNTLAGRMAIHAARERERDD